MTDMSDFRELGKALVPADEKDPMQRSQPVTRRKATIDSVVANTATCTINLNGVLIPGVEWFLTYFPLVGDVVWVDISGKKPIIVGPAGMGAWQTPTLGANWTNYYNGYTPIGYRRLASGLVELRGIAAAGVGAAITLFTLPVGFRPSTYHMVHATTYYSGAAWTAGTIYIFTTGLIQPAPTPPNGGLTLLDGVIFAIGQQ